MGVGGGGLVDGGVGIEGDMLCLINVELSRNAILKNGS